MCVLSPYLYHGSTIQSNPIEFNQGGGELCVCVCACCAIVHVHGEKKKIGGRAAGR